MFSSRTRWDRTANRLAQVLEHKRREGRAVLDLTVTNPTQAGLACDPELLLALADPRGRQYDPQPKGLASAREAVAGDYRRRGVSIDPSDLVLTASTSEAYAFLFKLLCDPGDEVLIPQPSYPLFDYLAGLESVRTVPYPLVHDGRWRLDRDALRAALTPRTRAIVVVSPNNPTGSFLDAGEADALFSLAEERSLALLSDEVFAEYAFAADARRAESFAAGGPALAFTLGGLSKSCGLPQLKLAWIAVTGPASLRQEALARLEIVADTYLSVSTPVQVAAPSLLARAGERQAVIGERVRRSLQALRAGLGAASAISLLEPEGGWSAVLRVPATRPEEDLVTALLEEDDVLVHPGYFFDFPREAFVVVSLLTPEDALLEGLDRLRGRFG